MAKGIGPVKLTRADQKILKSYIPTLQGLAAYLGSSYEIVLHSLEDYDHSVIGIINGEHTGRRIGAPITDLALDMLDELSAGGKASTVYFSRNKKGEPLKSTTIAVRGEHDRIIGLICINLYMNTSLCDILDGLTPGTVQAMAARENFAADAKELIVSACTGHGRRFHSAFQQKQSDRRGAGSEGNVPAEGLGGFCGRAAGHFPQYDLYAPAQPSQAY